jgi:hypothetical protein
MAFLLLCAGCSSKGQSVSGSWIWRDIPHTHYEIASPPDWRKDDDFISVLCLDGPPHAPGMVMVGNGRNGGTTLDEWIAGARTMLATPNSDIIARSVHEAGGRHASGLQWTTFEAVISERGMTNWTTVSAIDVGNTNWLVVTTQTPSSGSSHNDKAILEQIVNSIRMKSTPNQASHKPGLL